MEDSKKIIYTTEAGLQNEADPFLDESSPLSQPGAANVTAEAVINKDPLNHLFQAKRDQNYVPDFAKVSNGHNFTKIQEIEKTRSSRVYSVEENNVKYALKVYLKIVQGSDDEDYEFKVLNKIKAINSPLLAAPIDFWISDNHVFLLSPFYPEGDLDNILANPTKRAKFNVSSADFILNVFIPQAINALNDLHNNNIIHKDIKPSNFFLSYDDQGKIKIIIHDFGSAIIVDDVKETKMSKWRNEFTPPYKAPEVNQNSFNLKSDYFSLGLTILDLYLGMPWYTYGDKAPDVSNLDRLEYVLQQGVIEQCIGFYKNVDRNKKIEKIIENLVEPRVLKRWNYKKIDSLLKGEAEDISFVLNINFKGYNEEITNFEDLLGFVAQGPEYWDELASNIKNEATSAEPGHYLIHTVNGYPKKLKRFNFLVSNYDKKTFKDEDYILFESIIDNYFSDNIYYRSYHVEFGEEELERNILDDVSKDIFQAIHNLGRFKNNDNLKNDLYHFVASGALADYITLSVTNREKAEALKNYRFKYHGISELNPLIYLLSALTPLVLGEKEIITTSDFFKAIKEICENSYHSNGSVVLNEGARDLVKYMEEGTINEFLKRFSERERKQANLALNTLTNLQTNPEFYKLGKLGNAANHTLTKSALSLMLFYFMITPNSVFYYDKQNFTTPEALITYVLKKREGKQFPPEFINLNQDLLFTYWVRGIEERKALL